MKNRIPGEFRAGDDFGQEIGTADFGRAFFLDHPKNLARHSKQEAVNKSKIELNSNPQKFKVQSQTVHFALHNMHNHFKRFPIFFIFFCCSLLQR
jgi:hypothetical protein